MFPQKLLGRKRFERFRRLHMISNQTALSSCYTNLYDLYLDCRCDFAVECADFKYPHYDTNKNRKWNDIYDFIISQSICDLEQRAFYNLIRGYDSRYVSDEELKIFLKSRPREPVRKPKEEYRKDVNCRYASEQIQA